MNKQNPTLDEKEEQFREEVFSVALDNYDANMVEDFLDYWTEPNKSQTKMRCEGQKYFDIKRRLRTWNRNQSNWNKAKNFKVVEPKLINVDFKKYG